MMFCCRISIFGGFLDLFIAFFFPTYVLVHGIVALAFPFVFVVGLVCWVVFSCFGVEFWTNCFVWLCEFN